MSRTAELVLAVLLDVAVGEPPARLHPVVGMGRLADRLEQRLPAPDHPRAVVAGGAAWAVGLATVVALARVAARGPWWVRGVLLWPLFAARMLVAEVRAVETALSDVGLPAGRARVGRLVSRPTGGLDAGEVRMAAIETLAENTADSVVAPLLWWSVGGLPGAAAYRWVNTLDARWGYRTVAWHRRGRLAARADDLANLLPARLTAFLLAPEVALARPGVLRREAARTPSPNAGWPMAAMALVLDVRLAKRGTYELHPAGRGPDGGDLRRALRRGAAAMAATVVAAGVLARRREVTA